MKANTATAASQKPIRTLRDFPRFKAKAAFFDGGDTGPADRTKVWLALNFKL